MSRTLDVRADGRLLRFFDNLRVQHIADDGSVVMETDWETVSTEEENEISFRFEGETRTSLAVRYAFNARNQLTIVVPQQPGIPEDSATWTLPGKIMVDDVEDLEYVLIDEEGNLTTRRIWVYARLDFPEGYDRLRVVMPDQTETFIRGANKIRSLVAGEYTAGGDLARDLLAFRANTRNTINGQDEDTPADIRFYGRWDLHENSLVFVTRYETDTGGTPQLYLAIAGSLRGTNIGLVVEQDGRAAFQIQGRYQWNRATLGYDLSVGYSRSAGLEARLSADAEVTGKNGKLTIKGGATLKKGDQGTDLTFDLSIQYVAQNGQLTFRIEGDRTGYEIQFSGDFKISNGDVRFEIAFSDRSGEPILRGMVEFGRYTRNSELRVTLEAILTRNGLTLKLDIEFRFHWGPNGPVAELPEPPTRGRSRSRLTSHSPRPPRVRRVRHLARRGRMRSAKRTR